MEVHITADSQVHAEVLGEDLRNVRIVTRRPDISAVVRDIVQSIGYGARVAVVACGPARMADEARQACVGMVGRGFAGLEYFEESFKW